MMWGKKKKLKVSELGKLNEEEQTEVVILSKLINEGETIKDLVPFVKLEYGQVLQLKACVRGDGNELLQMVLSFNGYKISNKRLENTKAKKFFATINFIEKQFKYINELESKLHTETGHELVVAGIHELNQFGDINTWDALAGGDILKWEQVLKLNYLDVYNKLLKTKIENDVKRRLDENQRNKNK